MSLLRCAAASFAMLVVLSSLLPIAYAQQVVEFEISSTHILLRRGESAEIVVMVRPLIANLSQSAKVLVYNVPTSDLSVQVEPQQGTLPFTARITVKALPHAIPGNYTFKVVAMSGAESKEWDISVDILLEAGVQVIKFKDMVIYAPGALRISYPLTDFARFNLTLGKASATLDVDYARRRATLTPRISGERYQLYGELELAATGTLKIELMSNTSINTVEMEVRAGSHLILIFDLTLRELRPPGFQELSQKVVRLNATVARLIEGIGALGTNVETLSKQITFVQGQVKNLEDRLDALEGKVDGITGYVYSLVFIFSLGLIIVSVVAIAFAAYLGRRREVEYGEAEIKIAPERERREGELEEVD